MSDRRTRLVTLRDTLTLLIEDADEKTAPSLSRELRAVMAELESIPEAGKKATADELKERRAARQADAEARARSEGV
ncbi:hypothetical protein [Aeromicrobium sp.]|uniref:hypothetical protein n=1 Tax=Aeromicrobium sp. TaxID=1871063 RepID=UPI002FC6E64C